jgi:predicted nucleic acid-binding protein
VTVVLDASVAAKWLLPEPDSDKALVVLSAWNQGLLALIAPDLVSIEIANTLWKAAARGLIDSGCAVDLFTRFEALRLPLVPTADLVRGALDFSFLFKHPLYDCIYATLAVRERCDLLTADERLFHALRPAITAVRLLKNWSAKA